MSGDSLLTAEVALSVLRGCLIVSLSGDLNDESLTRVRQAVLNRVHHGAIKGVIFDMTGVAVLDTHAFAHLAETALMVRLLGSKAAFVGFQPGVVSFLVDMDAPLDDIVAFRSLERGMAHLSPLAPHHEEGENPEGDTEAWPEEESVDDLAARDG
ncbi:MAG TPA: STAS domain-containing protein [Syntrophales bacterium]|jgi:rsbT antagonist protein RsbS|nr:STAS domain-containing protein [Syntrophales bacterium]HOU78473.1 STAS domain-containing protein [Syntrophales bacterium]HPC32814.1 STAS domain-containing protein [Syntrophales bacterium]HQI36516.1 STAS domain-containing protein [Syntrophales bacterium]HRR47402.1 STAS domain-containing protein [Syntrophales bacterium]